MVSYSWQHWHSWQAFLSNFYSFLDDFQILLFALEPGTMPRDVPGPYNQVCILKILQILMMPFKNPENDQPFIFIPINFHFCFIFNTALKVHVA
jgi:hypothetical protein